MNVTLSSAGKTDVGKIRQLNEDSVYYTLINEGVLPNLFMVADGMGGHNGGEVASALAVQSFRQYVGRGNVKANPDETGYMDLMIAALAYANESILAKASEARELRGMGTTCSVCVLSGNKAEIVHIGDSRVYFVTKDTITQLTDDHSYVNEMVKAGRLTEEEACVHPKKNILTRALGVDYELEADGYVKTLEDDGVLLLCSDGLTNMLSNSEIMAVVNMEAPLDERADALIREANEHGGVDNISAVLVAVHIARCEHEA